MVPPINVFNMFNGRCHIPATTTLSCDCVKEGFGRLVEGMAKARGVQHIAEIACRWIESQDGDGKYAQKVSWP